MSASRSEGPEQVRQGGKARRRLASAAFVVGLSALALWLLVRLGRRVPLSAVVFLVVAAAVIAALEEYGIAFLSRRFGAQHAIVKGGRIAVGLAVLIVFYVMTTLTEGP